MPALLKGFLEQVARPGFGLSSTAVALVRHYVLKTMDGDYLTASIAVGGKVTHNKQIRFGFRQVEQKRAQNHADVFRMAWRELQPGVIEGQPPRRHREPANVVQAGKIDPAIHLGVLEPADLSHALGLLAGISGN